MSDEIADLYKALDKAIGGFETRMSDASVKAIERERAIVEAKMREQAGAFEAQLSALSRQIEALRKAGPGTAPPSPQPQPTQRPTAPQPRPAGTAFPPLPKPLTVGSLATYVRNLGFEVANHRPEGGLWVFQDEKTFGAVAKHIENGGVNCSYLPNGRKRRAGPQYHLDPLKRLPL
jgi:hypothetical protein